MDSLETIYGKLLADIGRLASDNGYELSLMLTPNENDLPLLRCRAVFRRDGDDPIEVTASAWLDRSVPDSPLTHEVLSALIRLRFATTADLRVSPRAKITLVVAKNAHQYESYVATMSAAKQATMIPAYTQGDLRRVPPEQILRIEFVGEYWQSPVYKYATAELRDLEQRVNGRVLYT